MRKWHKRSMCVNTRLQCESAINTAPAIFFMKHESKTLIYFRSIYRPKRPPKSNQININSNAIQYTYSASINTPHHLRTGGRSVKYCEGVELEQLETLSLQRTQRMLGAQLKRRSWNRVLQLFNHRSQGISNQLNNDKPLLRQNAQKSMSLLKSIEAYVMK